ncbi:hypothetical protein ACFLU1_00695 [Chloroflexota bacterium]
MASVTRANLQQLCLLTAESVKIADETGYKPDFNNGGVMAKEKPPRLTESVRGAG